MTEVSLSKNKELAYEYMEQVLACNSTHSLKAYYVGKKITPNSLLPQSATLTAPSRGSLTLNLQTERNNTYGTNSRTRI